MFDQFVFRNQLLTPGDQIALTTRTVEVPNWPAAVITGYEGLLGVSSPRVFNDDGIHFFTEDMVLEMTQIADGPTAVKNSAGRDDVVYGTPIKAAANANSCVFLAYAAIDGYIGARCAICLSQLVVGHHDEFVLA